MESQLRKDRISEPERNQLRLFIRLFVELVESRFARSVKATDHKISASVRDDGRLAVTGPHFDFEDFKSFLTVFRQLALAKRESAYLPKIFKILGHYGDDRLRDNLKRLSLQIYPRIEGKFKGIQLNDESTGTSYSSFQMLDALTNGIVFHSAEEHWAVRKVVGDSQPWFYLWFLLIEIVYPAIETCGLLAHIIRVDGFLDASELPPIRDLPPLKGETVTVVTEGNGMMAAGEIHVHHKDD